MGDGRKGFLGVMEGVDLGGPRSWHEVGVGFGENVEIFTQKVKVYGGDLMYGGKSVGKQEGSVV